ncbi:unnamed protein product [Victoria cruziana]
MSMNSERSKPGHRDQVREPGSVPFLWEERPGQPKKDYIIQALVSDPSPSEQPRQLEKDRTPVIDPRPAKLVISVPFEWEEEPGKPKASSPARFNSVLFYSPITEEKDDDDDEKEDRFEDCEENDDDELIELDLESFEFDENDLPIRSFSRSTPSMLANCMSTLSELSNAIPIEHTISITDYQTSSGPRPEKNSSEDSSYIEFHFPIVTPHVGFIQKFFAGENPCSDDGSRQGSATQTCCRIKCIKVKKTPPTLGDLIFMNCARGKPKKNLTAVHCKSHNSLHRMVCCAFGTGSGRLPPLKTEQP